MKITQNKSNRQLQLAFLLACIFAYSSLCAQTMSVRGKVIDISGNSLPGVSVLVKGTTKGTITDTNGVFSLLIPTSAKTLVFSLVGMKTQEVLINGKTTFDVVLDENIAQLNEMVVIGYGTLKKSDVTTSMSTIKEGDIKDQVIVSFEQALQGKSAGVVVREDSGEPGAGIEVSIRGANSINGANSPLYVVDGFPINLGGDASGDGVGTRSNPLAFLNPYDIESMDILKDAAATSIYGSRGSNGVVLITTKQAKQGKTRIEFSSKTTLQTVNTPYNLLGSADYAVTRNEYAKLNSPTYTEDEMWSKNLYPYSGGYGSPTPHPDSCTVSSNFLDAILRNALMQNYQLTISGGNSENKHIISAGYTSQEGIVIGSGLEKANARISLNNKVFPKFTLNTRLSFNYLSSSKTANSGSSLQSGPVYNALRMRPMTPVYSEDGEPVSYDIDGSYMRNPVVEATKKYDIQSNKDAIINVAGIWAILPSFTLNSRIGLSYRISTRDIFYPFETQQGQTLHGQAITNLLTNTFFSSEHFLQFNKVFDKIHSVNAVVGLSYEQSAKTLKYTEQSNFTFDELGIDALGLGTSLNAITSNRTTDVLKSGFLRINYSLKSKYILNFTGRADGSSKFGINNKWGYFPAGSIAWRAGNENFIKDLGVFSELKFRGSWGLVGSQAIPSYRTADTYTIDKYYLNYKAYSTTFAANLANPDLKWETTESKNIGIDISVLKNRLNISADYFIKDTHDLLTQRTLPTSSGFPNSWVNLGAISNKGIELELSAYLVNKKNFKWDLKANYSSAKTIIMDLGGIDYISGPQLFTSLFTMPAHRIIVGEELGVFYGYQTDGLIQIEDFVDYNNGNRNPKQVEVTYINSEGAEVTELKKSYVPVAASHNTPGQWKFKDVNHDDILSEADMKILGKSTPDFTFGLTNNFTFFKNWQLSMFFQGAFGFQILNLTKGLTSGWIGANARQEWFNNRWTLNNQHNDVNYPSPGMNEAVGKISDVLVEDGDYIKLQNMTLSYTLPLVKIKWIQKCAIYLTGTNLLTITKYSGQDPEVNVLGNNFQTPGVDLGAYPKPRLFTIGFDLTF